MAKVSAETEGQGASLFARLSISLPPELVVQLDAMMAERGLPSRSQVIAELIRHELADFGARQADPVIAGTITLIYRAESGRVRHALAQTQSAYLEEVISSQHVFLEDDQNIEVTIGHFEPVTDARTAAIHRRFIVVRYYQLRNA